MRIEGLSLGGWGGGVFPSIQLKKYKTYIRIGRTFRELVLSCFSWGTGFGNPGGNGVADDTSATTGLKAITNTLDLRHLQYFPHTYIRILSAIHI